MRLKILPVILLFFECLSLWGQNAISSPAEIWVDSVMRQMTVDEKIGQLFMIRAFSKEDKGHIEYVKSQIKEFHVGGICFFQGSPRKQVELVESYQSLSKIPLFIGIDGEWGLGMRFRDKAISFPKNITIGAIDDHQLIYRMGKEIGRQCDLLGVNINFAPVVDVNNNPDNPVINFRSFGEDKLNVASKSYAYMKGLQDAGILACAKHFPGHGDTATDSHFDLPVIPHNKSRLDSVELFPFKMMINQGIHSIMVAHLQVPALESDINRPTTVSKNVVIDLLRNELNFEGLIITDAMEMKAITKLYQEGEADLEAFLAGNDIILLPEKIEKGFEKIKEAVYSGAIKMERLDKSVSRILQKKYLLRLHKKKKFTDDTNLSAEINNPASQIIKSQIFEKALTLVINEHDILPVKDLLSYKFGSIALGSRSATPFQQRMLSYVNSDNYWLPKGAPAKDYDIKIHQLSKKDLVVVGLHDMSWYSKNNFGIDSAQISFIHRLSEKTEVVLVLFGSPYALKYFSNIPTVLVAYEDETLSHEAAAQGIFGANDINGRLPVSSEKFKAGHGFTLPGLKRLGFAIPESVGLINDSLQRIDVILENMIKEKAAPGGQILIAKDNKVVYWKSFGHYTYNRKKKVTSENIYDVASVTKIMASTISMMHLQDRGKFDLNKVIAQYVPEEDTTNKGDLVYVDIMAHMGKLLPWIPFYAYTLTKDKKHLPDKRYYTTSPDDTFSIRVDPDLYLRNDYPDTIWRKIFSSSLRESDSYRYSDLAFYIINKTIQNIAGVQVDEYAKENFYRPLGLRSTTFNPLDSFEKDIIVPSEKDDYFRRKTVQGTVHDMGAAMMNGVSGHAGLFSNALDMAILMQMLINDGYYGGMQFIQPATIKKYTQRHWRSTRRGIGFDMKELNPARKLNMSDKASRHTFGHLGFTGTAVFGDPESKIVYVFLSNRTYPTMENNKFGKNNYRPKVQTVVYNALMPE